MFWKLGNQKAATSGNTVKKLPKPKSIVEKVGRILITDFNQDPDIVWQLFTVTRPDEAAPKHVKFRVFDLGKVSAANIKVVDYHSLDTHPEQVLWEGWYQKDDYRVQFASTE